ncbi:hypothetical protein ACFYOK_33155 [Microbispora bryophytorum]|uniref:hypothetical protein n=1 Tax=Microbispora bryophytorum TaxID=1460882 RepID=UPI0034051DDE
MSHRRPGRLSWLGRTPDRHSLPVLLGHSWRGIPVTEGAVKGIEFRRLPRARLEERRPAQSGDEPAAVASSG